MKSTIEIWRTFSGRSSGIYTASHQELAELLTKAEMAQDADPWDWPALAEVLTLHGGMPPKKVKAEVRRCRITSDLGTYPHTINQFIPAFLKSRGYRMNFGGQFARHGGESDADYIFNLMVIWCQEMDPAQPVYSPSLIDAAFRNWQSDEKARMLRTGYDRVAFDANADATILKTFAAYITEPVPNDPVATERTVRATEVTLANFIFRVKNHMRGKWRHSSHLMPVLAGKQGSAKSHAVTAFLGPISDLSSAVGFELFGDNSKEYELSLMPVMFFEEMAGIGKADVEKLKGVMTLARRSFRQIYGKATTRTVISTFIGCSNRDISTLIRDETGNRRFIQIETPLEMNREVIDGFDMLSVWRSVDEDAEEPPMYANAADLEAIKVQQSEQRFRGIVYEWILNATDLPFDAVRVPELYADHFRPWAERMFPREHQWVELNTFRKEIERIRKEEAPHRILKTIPKNVVHYRFVSEDASPARSRVHAFIQSAKPEGGRVI